MAADSISAKQIKQWDLPVLANRRRGEHYRELVLDAPELAAILRPGQFVNVRCSESWDPLLRRPFSLYRIDPGAGTISLLYAIAGKGTAIIARWEPGDRADLLGPLGNWFPVPAGANALALVAGGIGVAPLVALAEAIIPSGRPLHVLLGARAADLLLCEEELRALGATVTVATDDGSRGHHGFVTGILQEKIRGSEGVLPVPFDAVLTCGPRPMMAAVSRVAQAAGIPCYVSMEVGMACGFGVCMGCAWRVQGSQIEGEQCSPTQSDIPVYRLVCTDGPVFDAAEIIWDK